MEDEKKTFYFLGYGEANVDVPSLVFSSLACVGDSPPSQLYVDTTQENRGLTDIKGLLEVLVPHYYNAGVKVYAVDISDYFRPTALREGAGAIGIVFSRSRERFANDLFRRLSEEGHEVVNLNTKNVLAKKNTKTSNKRKITP